MHCANDIREAWQDYLENAESLDRWQDNHNGWHSYDDLVGRLWHCTNTMPASACAAHDLPQGSTYAQSAQKYRREMMVGQRPVFL